MKLLSALLIIPVLLAVPVAHPAGVPLGTLQGVVVDAHGKAVAGATVTIQTSDGQHPHATRTDAHGRFEFARFETGQYDLRAYWRGAYSDWAKRVVIHAHKPTQISLQIKP